MGLRQVFPVQTKSSRMVTGYSAASGFIMNLRENTPQSVERNSPWPYQKGFRTGTIDNGRRFGRFQEPPVKNPHVFITPQPHGYLEGITRRLSRLGPRVVRAGGYQGTRQRVQEGPDQRMRAYPHSDPPPWAGTTSR